MIWWVGLFSLHFEVVLIYMLNVVLCLCKNFNSFSIINLILSIWSDIFFIYSSFQLPSFLTVFFFLSFSLSFFLSFSLFLSFFFLSFSFIFSQVKQWEWRRNKEICNWLWLIVKTTWILLFLVLILFLISSSLHLPNIFLYIHLFTYLFFEPYPQHAEVLEPGIELTPQQ